MRAEVVKRGAQIGIALDGDADRVIVVDEKGPDRRRRRGHGDVRDAHASTTALLEEDTVVATVMTNLGLERAMRAARRQARSHAVGDRYVVEAMRAGGYNLGGEQSGHLVFLDHASTGDGIVAALQVLGHHARGRATALRARRARDAARPAGARERDVRVAPAARSDGEDAAPRCARSSVCSASGRVLVRWSGTEAKLRVMVEGEDEPTIRSLSHAIVSAAKEDMG